MAGEPLGPLHGVPFSVKDLLFTRGVRTTMGSRIFADQVPAEDAVPVRRLREAGAILVGKTTTPEFGHKPHDRQPAVRRHPQPVGSLAQRGRLVREARPPPSRRARGRWRSAPTAAAPSASPRPAAASSASSPRSDASRTCIRPISSPRRPTSDPWRGPWPRPPRASTRSSASIRAIPTPARSRSTIRATSTCAACASAGFPGSAIGSSMRTCSPLARRRCAIWKVAGAVVETVEEDVTAFEQAFLVFFQGGLAARVGPHMAAFGDKIARSLRESVERGARWSAVDWANALGQRTAMYRRVQALFRRFDFLVSPTISRPALAVDHDPFEPITIGGETAGSIRGAWYPYLWPFNLSGHPAVSLPCGWSVRRSAHRAADRRSLVRRPPRARPGRTARARAPVRAPDALLAA